MKLDRVTRRKGGWMVCLKVRLEGERSARTGNLRGASIGCVMVAEREDI